MQPLKKETKRMPALFIGHGNPMNAIEKNEFTDSLKRVGKMLEKPKAILFISAHWTTSYSAAALHSDENVMYDMYGFPDALYNVKYKAKNAEFLIPKLQKLIPSLKVENRDLDHGVWSVLVHLFPKMDTPVIQLSINSTLSLQEHFETGKTLGILREEEVIIIASGNVTHNLREAVLFDKNAPIDSWAKEFDGFVKDSILRGDFDALLDIENRQRYAHLAHPSTEHYIPLLYIAGAMQKGDKSSFLYEGIEHGNLSMRSWMIQ
ncbi:class III extradiol ring-cleavage dioxygenase [Sulfurimonas sp. HSL-1716]|uniref:dioxygenase family protein n=1 Tax=Hydrocurvibacter sulfurireducens TaxID=3131937 RepID=UPI0031F82B9F